jgi:hypothetical protein
MRQLASLTLKILRSLYPWTNLDVVGEGFVEDSIVMVSQIMEMLPVNMS